MLVSARLFSPVLEWEFFERDVSPFALSGIRKVDIFSNKRANIDAVSPGKSREKERNKRKKRREREKRITLSVPGIRQ